MEKKQIAVVLLVVAIALSLVSIVMVMSGSGSFGGISSDNFVVNSNEPFVAGNNGLGGSISLSVSEAP
ncbi:MAG: hypothetical protein AABY10_04360 [Nanoarchaeota archaeon]